MRTSFRASQYIFFEMLPTFLLGLSVFIFVMLMFQALRLTEFALVHGVGIKTVLEIMGYMSISLLPALFPMALLFSIISTYSRLSSDSEIVALKAIGLNMISIATPAIILSLLIAIISTQTSFNLAPWGNSNFEMLMAKLSNSKAAASIREGAFSEGFFDMVVYANKVDSKEGTLQKVFIYDEKLDAPVTIISKHGQIIQDPDMPGHAALLRLQNGDIHRKTDSHTKIKFNSFDIKLTSPLKDANRERSNQSLTLKELQEKLKDTNLKEEDKRTVLTEYQKRWAIAALCLIFALIGIGSGTQTNKRQQKSGGAIKVMGYIILYWVLYVSFEGMARSGKLQPVIAVWTPNFIFLLIAIRNLKKNWN